MNVSMVHTDLSLRLSTFNWLAEQVDLYGDVLDWTVLKQGFELGVERIHVVSPQGIFSPAQMELPLSIRTAVEGPYDDSLEEGHFLQYRYRGTNPNHRDNVGLREVMRRQLPLVYFFGLIPGRYLTGWPGDILDAMKLAADAPQAVAEGAGPRRVYVTSTVRARLHQRSFRERVIEAYRSTCALCRLRHRRLLDAAHIIPDSEEGGLPTVSNGLSLCKLHHAAFDQFMLGISPDYEIQIREDVLAEHDGPMLVHGLQELHGQRIQLPHRQADRPSRDALAWRYERFITQ
jgi:putative restriction endonuclease